MAYPGGFSLATDPGVTQMLECDISSQTLALGDVIELVGGTANWAAVTSTSTARTLKAVCQEAAASSATTVKAILCTPWQLWVAETDADSVVANQGDRFQFTDANTVDTATGDRTTAVGCFQQVEVVGALTDKRILGRFCGLYGNATV